MVYPLSSCWMNRHSRPQSPGGAGPTLTAISAGIQRVLDSARREGAIAGIHSCASLPLAFFAQLDLDLLSFDAHLPIDKAGFAHLARVLDQRRGFFAYGLAPTGATEVTVGAMQNRWLELASFEQSARAIATRSLVTATCGLGLSTPAQAANSFALARQLGTWLRSHVSEADAQLQMTGSN